MSIFQVLLRFYQFINPSYLQLQYLRMEYH